MTLFAEILLGIAIVIIAIILIDRFVNVKPEEPPVSEPTDDSDDEGGRV